jgi:hypothetical protein
MEISAKTEVAPQAAMVLVEAAQLPWASIGTLAVRTTQAVDDVIATCNVLIEAGFMQCATVALSAYPKRLFAPTTLGVSAAAGSLDMHPDDFARQTHLTESRFWALRAGWEMAQEINAIAARTKGTLTSATIDWETFVERRHKRQSLFLHGRFAVTTKEGVLPFYVLLERDGSSPWHWYRTLKYLQAWAARSVGLFPPVLVVARRALNVQIILSVNHMAGGVRLFATFDRYAALAGGLSACEWHILRPDQQIVLADPLQLSPMTMADYAASVHRVRRIAVSDHAQQWGYRAAAHQAWWPGFSLEQLPVSLLRLPDVDRLDDLPYGMLKFLAAHPVCPTSTLAEFNRMTVDKAMAILQALQRTSFVEPVEEHRRDARWTAIDNVHDRSLTKLALEARRILVIVRKQAGVRTTEIARTTTLPVAPVQACLEQLKEDGFVALTHHLPENQLWVATDMAVGLVAARAMQPVESITRRHRFFRADHTRRSQHTRETYGFFETLHQHCIRRSRASAHFDASARSVDDGAIPFYELVDFESEMTAAAWYVFRGQARFWRPDGFGLLRAGRAYTPFWLEIDGTTTTRSHRDADLWEDKLGRMCDYLASEHWRLKQDVFPRLLIVSSAVRQRAGIAEALEAAVRSRSAVPPWAFITGHEALAQRGPLGPIWFPLVPTTHKPTYAFDGVAPDVIQSAARPRNLLDDLDHADRIGLIDLVARQVK